MRTRGRGMIAAGLALAALTVIVALVAGNHHPATSSGSADKLLGLNPTASGGAVALPGTAQAGRHAEAPALQHASLPNVQARVIRTADVSLRVDHGDLQDTVVKARQLARTYGGMVAASSFSSQQHMGSVELRVPSAHFD